MQARVEEAATSTKPSNQSDSFAGRFEAFALKNPKLASRPAMSTVPSSGMYRIKTPAYGIRLTFGGFIRADEMESWLAESASVLDEVRRPFCVFVDMRTLKPLDAAAQATMKRGQSLYRERGMARSVVILSDPVTTMQFRRIARETGIDANERYVDSSVQPQWERGGLLWLMEKREPPRLSLSSLRRSR